MHGNRRRNSQRDHVCSFFVTYRRQQYDLINSSNSSQCELPAARGSVLSNSLHDYAHHSKLRMGLPRLNSTQNAKVDWACIGRPRRPDAQHLRRQSVQLCLLIRQTQGSTYQKRMRTSTRPALACLWSLAGGSSGRLAERFLCCSCSFSVRRFSSSSRAACAQAFLLLFLFSSTELGMGAVWSMQAMREGSAGSAAPQICSCTCLLSGRTASWPSAPPACRSALQSARTRAVSHLLRRPEPLHLPVFPLARQVGYVLQPCAPAPWQRIASARRRCHGELLQS